MPVLLKSRGLILTIVAVPCDMCSPMPMAPFHTRSSCKEKTCPALHCTALHCTGYRSTALNMNTTAQHVGGGKSSMVHRVGDDWPWADMLIMMRISGSGSGGGEITKKRKRMPVWWMDEIPLCVGGSPVRTMDVTIQWRCWKGRR